MKNLRNVYGPPKRINDSTYSIDVMAGSNITGTIAEAISVARGLDTTMQFEFNGVRVQVRADSNPELIYRDWDRALHGFIKKTVGPNPAAALTPAELASDASIKAKNDRKYAKEQKAYREKAEAHAKAVEAKLVGAPDFEPVDADKWKEFQELHTRNPYDAGILAYATRWARLMQVEMANGKKLEDVADATSSEADLEGMSGFSYGIAVGAIAEQWKFGDQLRRWHNHKYQLGNEGDEANDTGGVLNPAMLVIGRK